MYKDMIDTIGFVSGYDPELGAAMQRELGRQQANIELIASENIVSPAVMAAMGSVLTNKYAEGYPGHRYYGGCQFVDQVEQIAIDRACKLFGAKYANVQPHSGAQANLAVYFALLNLGDTVMGMDLSQGGHLTHGSPANMSGKNYNFVSYGVSAEDGRIDYDALAKQVAKVRPKLLVAGASAYPRAIDFEKLAEIAGVKCEELASEMFAAGSNLKNKSPEEIFYQDFKKFELNKSSFGVGQITSVNADELTEIKKELLPYMEKALGSHGESMLFFMLTDIINESTELLFYGGDSKNVVSEAFHKEPQEGEQSVILPGVVSRKKQLIPALINTLAERKM